jgi:hypothetical protein
LFSVLAPIAPSAPAASPRFGRDPARLILGARTVLAAGMRAILEGSDMTTPLVIWALILVIYFVPTLVAGWHRHRNSGAICALNLFLGWTFLGWIIALVWAFTRSADSRRDNYDVDTAALRRNIEAR